MLHRPRLLKRLQQAMTKKLTLICAPAGSGKTTLISAWSREQAIPVAWYSISQRDNDPFLFINCLIGALQVVDPSFGETTISLINSSVGLSSGTQPASEIEKKAAEFLFRDICDYKNPLVLVLDDFHFVTNTRISKGWAFYSNFFPIQRISLSVRVVTRYFHCPDCVYKNRYWKFGVRTSVLMMPKHSSFSNCARDSIWLLR